MAQATASKKVGGDTTSANKKGNPDKEPKKGRTVFDFSTATNETGESVGEGENAIAPGASVVNDDGLLLAVPSIIKTDTDDKGKVTEKFVGWNPKAHKPLVRKDFASDDIFLDFRVWCLDLDIKKKTKNRDSLAKRADRLRKFGDEKTRKKAAKLARMREQMAALEAELESDGVDVSDV